MGARHVVVFERRGVENLKKSDYRAMSFETSEEDLDLIQDLCNDWNGDSTKTSDADFMPIDMAIARHNGTNDEEFRVASEGGLLLAYQGKKVTPELIIKILNLEYLILEGGIK